MTILDCVLPEVPMDAVVAIFGNGLFWLFLCVLLIVVCAFVILLLRDFSNRQKMYRKFSGHLEEFVVVLSHKLEFLYGMPQYMSDPLFEQLNQGKTFQDILTANNWARMSAYFEDVEKHFDLPFLFSFAPSDENGNDGEVKNQWYEMIVSIERVSSFEVNYVCFVKNISKIYEIRMEKERVREDRDWLLKNTGDFLWQFDVENRAFWLRTSIMDETHHVFPIPAGAVDIHGIMPEEDYALFDRIVNERVKVFKEKGFGGDPFETFRVRFYGSDKNLVWYGLRGKVYKDENEKFWFQGVARRMDIAMDTVVYNDENSKEIMISSFWELPDVRIFWIGRDYKIQGCNQAFATDFQIIDTRETIGRTLEQVVGQKFLPYISRILSEVMNLGHAVSWKGNFGKKGRLLMFNVVPLKTTENSVSSVIAYYLVLDSDDFKDET